MPAKTVIAWILLTVSLIGFFVCMPLWLLDAISDRAMIGLTLALSWLALVYEGFNAIEIHKDE